MYRIKTFFRCLTTLFRIIRKYDTVKTHLILEDIDYMSYSHYKVMWHIEKSTSFKDDVYTYFQVKNEYENSPDKRTSEARKLRDTMSNLEHIIHENM